MNPSEDQILELEKMILKQFNWNEEERIHAYKELLKRMGQGKKRRKSKYHAYYETFCELAQREEGVGKNQLIGIEGNPWTRKHGNATQAVKGVHRILQSMVRCRDRKGWQQVATESR